jgi:hypothetical protein
MATLEQLTPQEAVANLRNAGFNKQADAVERNFKKSGAITSADLTPQPNFKTTPPPAATAGAGLTGAIEATQDDFTKQLEQKAKEAETMKDIAQKEYLKSILGTEGEVESTAKEYSKKGGVDDIQTELNDINQQIRVEQNALQREIERIQTAPGSTKGQIDLEVAERQRVSLRKQADLSLILLGVQGRYSAAKEIADRAVAVKMEQQKIKNEALRIQYEDNKELFNKAEQRQFESLLADRERKFAKEEADELAKYNSAIEAQKNGAPTSIVKAMLDSKTKEEALGVGGSYIGLLERQKTGMAMRSALIDNALKGDTSAINQLGYDPRGFTKEAIEAKQKEEATYDTAVDVLDKTRRSLSNSLGLRAAVSSGPISGFLTTLGLGARNVTGMGIGETERGKNIIQLRDEFLANVGVLIEKDTLDALGNLPVKLTPLTNEDVALVRRSASALGGLAEIKDGKVVRIGGSPAEVERLIKEMETSYINIIDTLNRNGVSSTEIQEAANIFNSI